MVEPCSGSLGPELMARQAQLIRLGFLAAEADGLFDAATIQAIRDLQRRWLLRPDGRIDAATAAALDRASASAASEPVSAFRRLLLQARELASQGKASDDQLPLLDQGLAASPLRLDPGGFPARLAAAAAATATPSGSRGESSPQGAATSARPYPPLGTIPPIHSDPQSPGGLSFLSDRVSQACLCIAEPAPDGAPLRLRSYGRRPLECVQFWSATKWIAPLQLVCQAARVSPAVPIGLTQVRAADGRSSVPFGELFEQMVSYAGDGADPGRSNAIGYLFKQLRNPGEPDVQTWLRQTTGHGDARFLGRYGREPLLAGAELIGPGGRLIAHGPSPRSRNLISAYDLVRLLTLLGWHLRLDQDQRLPWATWSSLATLVQGLGHDTARYIDHALVDLGLGSNISEPVILSKMGFGAETGDGAIDALTYVAFVSLLDQRTHPPLRRSFALALRIPTRPGGGLEADARMGSEVIEVVRRIFSGALA